MEQYTQLIITILTLIASNVTTFFFARRKSKAIAQGSEIGNINTMLDVYEKILDNLSERIKKQLETIEMQEVEISTLKKRIQEMKHTANDHR